MDERRSAIMKCLCLALILLLSACGGAQVEPTDRPQSTETGWVPLFADDLSNAINPNGVWTSEEGVLTAAADSVLWTTRSYDDYILELEFRNEEGTNSGVIIHASDVDDWVPNSLEVQIADDFAPQWADAPANWQAGAIFGHQAATQRTVRPPGEWNQMSITTRGDSVLVTLNGARVNALDMREFTSAETNPDGSEIPEWLSKPVADLPSEGHIGLQGKHAGANIWFRNIRIREIQ